MSFKAFRINIDSLKLHRKEFYIGVSHPNIIHRTEPSLNPRILGLKAAEANKEIGTSKP